MEIYLGLDIIIVTPPPPLLSTHTILSNKRLLWGNALREKKLDLNLYFPFNYIHRWQICNTFVKYMDAINYSFKKSEGQIPVFMIKKKNPLRLRVRVGEP